MRKKIITAILFFSAAASAQVRQSPGSTYGGTYGDEVVVAPYSGTANGAYGGIGYPPPLLPAESCLRSICGTPAEAKPFTAQSDDRVSAYVRAYLTKSPEIDYPDSVKNLFSELKATSAKEDERAVAKLQAGVPPEGAELNGAARSMYNLSHFGGYLNGLKFKSIQKDGQTKIIVDEGASSEALKKVPEAERKLVIEGANYLASTGKKESLSMDEIQAHPSEVSLKELYPDLPLKSALQAEYAKAKSSLAQFKKLSPLEQILYADAASPEHLAALEQKVSDGSITDNETRDILGWNFKFEESRTEYSDPANPLTNKFKPLLSEVLKEAGGLDSLTADYKKMRLQSETKRTDQIEECKVRYYLNKNLLPNKSQIDHLKEDIEKARQLAKDMIASHFPKAVQAKMMEAVDNTDFILPPTAAEFERDFTQNLQLKLENEKSSLEAIEKVSPADIQGFLGVFALAGKKDEQNPNIEKKPPLNSFCDSFNYQAMSDQNYTTLGKIELSFTTATGKEESRMGTLLHEIGHSISKAGYDLDNGTDKIPGVRQCLTDEHTEELPPELKKALEEAKKISTPVYGPYEEEDFSDSVAGESARSLSKRNPWCQFLTVTSDGVHYLEYSPWAGYSDGHSASLFRMLNFEFLNKGNLPDECHSYLKQIHYAENFKACLDPANSSARPAAKTGPIVQ
jgi:hypothetical protein